MLANNDKTWIGGGGGEEEEEGTRNGVPKPSSMEVRCCSQP